MSEMQSAPDDPKRCNTSAAKRAAIGSGRYERSLAGLTNRPRFTTTASMMQEGVPRRCASCEREHGASARERIESRVEARLARLRSEGAAPSMASSSSPRPPPPATRGTGSDDRGEDPKIVWMNCDRDGSLTEAIAHAEAGPLVVHVVGTCRESVRVARADVTIAGDASGAVI